MIPQRLRLIALVVVALCFGAFAFYQIATRTRAAPDHADFYCYELHRGWVCTYARKDCLARQEREAAGDVTKRCAGHYDEVLTP